jgi:hypothetical protein
VPSFILLILKGANMNEINIEGKIFKKYDDNYYISQYGDIYSMYSHKCLKHNIDCDGYHRVDIHGKHKKVHILVYLCWIGEIKNNYQINHKDDNKNNNYYLNLYAGTQKQNIQDCINNQHRKGNIHKIKIYDNKINKILEFDSCKKFIKYSKHPQKSGSLKKCLNKKWFKERYMLLEYN